MNPPLDAERVIVTSGAELSPCPFCGDVNPNKYWVNGLARKHPMAYIECDLGECAARSGEFDTMPAAIAAWNLRATQRESGGGWIPADKAPAGHSGIVRQELAEGTWRYLFGEWRVARGVEGWFDNEGSFLPAITYWMPIPNDPAHVAAIRNAALSASQRKECETCKERPGLVRVTDGNPMLGAWDLCPDCKTCPDCNGTGQRKETP